MGLHEQGLSPMWRRTQGRQVVLGFRAFLFARSPSLRSHFYRIAPQDFEGGQDSAGDGRQVREQRRRGGAVERGGQGRGGRQQGGN